MDLQSLRQRFPLPGLAFDNHNGLTRLQIKSPQTQATLYLQGAHLTHWQPAGADPVLFLSRQSDFAPGKPIRGGIPVVFPWFATDTKPDRIHDATGAHPGPSHGFARIQPWELTAAHVTADATQLTFTLAPTGLSRSMGFASFHLTLDFLLGRTLTVRLTVRNTGTEPLHFEEAFHTYYAVADAHEVSLTGLESTPYIDKTDNFTLKPAANHPFTPTQKTDRIYNATAAPCVLTDPTRRRRITVRKTNSNSTVVFNPWDKMPDLGEWEWHEFLAVETANVGSDAITLHPGQTHTMQLEVTLDRT